MEGTVDLVICFLSLQGEGLQDLNISFAKETQNGGYIKHRTPKNTYSQIQPSTLEKKMQNNLNSALTSQYS